MTGFDLHIQAIPSEQAPMHLLLEADPSESKIREYLASAHCYIANRKPSGEMIGVFVLLPIRQGIIELVNIAVAPNQQGKGIGTQLLHRAIGEAKKLGARKLEVGTGSFGYQLGFYQRAGFRVERIDKDFFLKNYREPIFESGIQHKDMLRLSIDLQPRTSFQ